MRETRADLVIVGSGAGGGTVAQRLLPLARAAAAVGVDGIFLEVHDRPETARCDGHNSFPLERIPEFLDQVLRIRDMVKEWEGESPAT